jgi:hypothetical protein
VENTCRDKFEGTTCESRRDCGPRLGCFDNVCAASAEAPKTPRKAKRSSGRDRTWDDDSASTDGEEGGRDRVKDKSAGRGLIAGGAVLTSIGWAAVLVGIPILVLGATGNNDGFVKGGGVAIGAGSAIGISGSIMLGIGVRQRRKARYEEREERGFIGPTEVATPGLTLTFPIH